ncbi:uncharacterized protein DSM5745_04880 [Aspergillus mulundensis]|uniref:Uncharacterized protein n=1 Tax=Aspergillus mulundensis TaxID=1810919 RepID=A0A3D8S4U6_9EURO|nr:hypothetical protein DSM5745_04880 [Aspergillus mulundensis]RDW81323.1 hypothetical protein DSM5745_04880 [Aspergillus mulundensis]
MLENTVPEGHSSPQSHQNTENASPLQAYLNTLRDSSSPLSTTVEALHSLFTNPIHKLTPSITPAGKRLFSITNTENPSLSGTADLNTLGRIHLVAADRCTRAHAPLKMRFMHASLDEPIEELYGESEDLLRAGLKDGSVVFPPLDENERGVCACCRGDPDAVILCSFHHNEALFFFEDEYRVLFGEERECGSRSGGGERWLMASKEQIERKIEEEEKAINMEKESKL